MRLFTAIVAVLAIGLMAGCGSSKNSDSGNTLVPTTPTTTPATTPSTTPATTPSTTPATTPSSTPTPPPPSSGGTGAEAGTYSGQTDQGQSITITVSDSQSACGKDGHKAPCILKVHYLAEYSCKTTSGGTSHPSSAQPTTLNATNISGGESNATFGDAKDQIKFKATFSGTSANGSFNETYKSKGGSTCNSGDVNFDVTHS
jgi:hypothetical protein